LCWCATGGGQPDCRPRRLGAHIEATAGHEFVFVTDYPASVRPFYHLRPDGQPAVTARHGGFGLGLGLARLLMAMLGLGSIRDATYLFRGPNRLSP
jgi:aspartyl/asparaginyl-tRNA synthetase